MSGRVVCAYEGAVGVTEDDWADMYEEEGEEAEEAEETDAVAEAEEGAVVTSPCSR